MRRVALRVWLLGSYLLLMLVMLGIIAGASFLFFSARPAPPQPTYERLNGIMQGLNLRQYLPQRGVLTLDEVYAALGTVAVEREVRIIALNVRSNEVLFDSAGTLSAERLPRFYIENRQETPLLNIDSVLGSFVAPEGDEWLFTGLITQRLGRDGFTLLLADERPTQSLAASLRALGTSFALPLVQAALVGLLVAVLLALLISRSIARPLQHVARAASAVAEGRFDQHVPVSGPPEVRSVGEAFNRMSAEVVANQTAQRDFLANVSHDLKTPLTSIQGYSQAIMDGATDDPGDAAAVIHDEATRLNRMVVQLTDLARIQAGQITMQTEPVDVGEIAASVADRLAVMAQRKAITLHNNADSLPAVRGDGDRLAQVMTNLISNAIKYTPEGGRVTVSTSISESGVKIDVADTGIGIPREDLPRIFERFYQVDKARGPRRGSGLGLAITREIVDAHGGTITVASPGPGKGSTFTVWLPAKIAAG